MAAPQNLKAMPSIQSNIANIHGNVADLDTAEAIPGRRYYTGSRTSSSRTSHRGMHRG